ncbi:MAG: glycosyltransferase family 4 protein [Pseudomonadota bacterium]
MKGHLLFIVNDSCFFVSHRLAIAQQALRQGYRVSLAGPGECPAEVASLGIGYNRIGLSRQGMNPLHEAMALLEMYRLLRSIKPDIVHAVTIKPVLYGGIASRLAGVPAYVAAVSGLGTVFVANGFKARVVKWLVGWLYRAALGHANAAVIFQNPEDRDALMRLGAVVPEQARLIRGSGVALESCPHEPEPGGKPVVTMAARLLRDKGVMEFVQAARLLAERGVPVTCRLIGSPDPGNPTTITAKILAEWHEEGVVELPGYLGDIPAQYAQSHIVCLPSYREGLPKGLVEAAACGRAVITTDVPGCRDAIEPSISGLLVPPRDASALADAIQRLVENPQERHALGQAGRELAEREFAIDKIVSAHLGIYRELWES